MYIRFFCTPMYKGMDSEATPLWWKRIVWPNLCYNAAVLALLITTVVLSANTLGRVEKEVTTCRLRYEGSDNDLTEQQFQAFAKSAGWTLTHPEPPDCNRCKEPDRFPVWMAPVDICSAFGLSSSHPFCTPDTAGSEASHVKVCATQVQIDKPCAGGGCHSWSGNETQPFLGYDGALFCQHPNCPAGLLAGSKCTMACYYDLTCQQNVYEGDSCTLPYKKIMDGLCEAIVKAGHTTTHDQTKCVFTCPVMGS